MLEFFSRFWNEIHDNRIEIKNDTSISGVWLLSASSFKFMRRLTSLALVKRKMVFLSPFPFFPRFSSLDFAPRSTWLPVSKWWKDGQDSWNIKFPTLRTTRKTKTRRRAEKRKQRKKRGQLEGRTKKPYLIPRYLNYTFFLPAVVLRYLGLNLLNLITKCRAFIFPWNKFYLILIH